MGEADLGPEARHPSATSARETRAPRSLWISRVLCAPCASTRLGFTGEVPCEIKKRRDEHPSSTLDNPHSSVSVCAALQIRSSQQLTVLGCCLLTKSEMKSNSFWPRKSSGSSWTRSKPSSMTSEVRTSSSIISASMPFRARAGPAMCCMLAS